VTVGDRYVAVVRTKQMFWGSGFRPRWLESFAKSADLARDVLSEWSRLRQAEALARPAPVRCQPAS
jgi:hypothetical protein